MLGMLGHVTHVQREACVHLGHGWEDNGGRVGNKGRLVPSTADNLRN